MTQEEKELLLKYLCGLLPYGVILHDEYCKKDYKLNSIDANGFINYDIANSITHIKPYLRSMSSMTEGERTEMGAAIQKDRIQPYGEIKNFGEDNLLLCTIRQSTNLQDWLNTYHFDYRGLIPMGLAIEAPEGMYNENC